MENKNIQIALEALLAGCQDIASVAGTAPAPFWGIPDLDPSIEKARLLASGGQSLPDAKPNQLLSPFCGLSDHQTKMFLPIQRLDPSKKKAIFPSDQQSKNPVAAIHDLWTRLDSDWQAFIETDPDVNAQVEQLLAWLQDYAWCIPSGIEDVSIYDLARLSAGIAICQAEGANDAGHIALLVSGDISGLQAFLYTLTSGGAAKSLRARSVYLQWLTDAIVLSLLSDLGLPSTNIVYAGGGSFQLLVPPGKKDQVEKLATDLNQRLLALHNGSLSVTLAYQPLNEADFSDFGKARARLGKKLNRAKRRPFSAMQTDDLLEAIGTPISQGGDPLQFCQVTGEDGKTIETRNDETKSLFVWSLEDLGRDLPSATHLVYMLGQKLESTQAVNWQQALKVFGFYAELVTRKEQDKPIDDLPNGLRYVVALMPDVPADWVVVDGPIVSSFRPFAQLAASIEDKQSKRPKTFDELAKDSTGGFKRWGVLRLDMDNLGSLFRDGYGDKVSIARYAGLSFALQIFFEGWLPQLAQGESGSHIPGRERDLTDYLYLQYSGGDDVFIVGSWDALPEFALRISRSLSELAGQNPHVTISAGIELFPAKFPIYQAARIAGEAEKMAKDHPGKNAIAFLGQVMGWGEFAEVQKTTQKLADMVENNILPASTMQTILMLQVQMETENQRQYQERLQDPNQAVTAFEGTKPAYGPWTWMAAYQLTRVRRSIPGGKHKNRTQEEADQMIHAIQQEFLKPQNQAHLERHALAARWAQFLTRGGE